MQDNYQAFSLSSKLVVQGRWESHGLVAVAIGRRAVPGLSLDQVVRLASRLADLDTGKPPPQFG